MKREAIWAILLMVALSCGTQQDETPVPDDLTGNSITYSLQSGSTWNLSGTVVLSEKKDGSSLIDIKFDNLDTDNQHPVHLHFGNISIDKANVAALLNPVDGKTGESRTNLKILADETLVTFNDIKQLDACIKIHLSSSGDGQSIILAATNIGSAKSNPVSRSSIGVCKSN